MTADILAKTISPLSGFLGKDQKRHPRSSSQPFIGEEQVEGWELKASDALREEILSSHIPVSDWELARIFKKYDADDNRLFESVETETHPLLREAAEVPALPPAPREPDTAVASAVPARKKSLGIFSDSRIYSAMIRHELKHHDVIIEHFHHPTSFQPERFDLFDSIDAWMVFLSDAYEGDFLEQFLERYADKPTLFLFEKSQRRRTSRNIDQFLADNGLTRVKSIKPMVSNHTARTGTHPRPRPHGRSPQNPKAARRPEPGVNSVQP